MQSPILLESYLLPLRANLIMDLFELLPQGPDTILLFSLVSRQGTSYVAIPHMFKAFNKMFSHDPTDFSPFMRQSQTHLIT